MIWYIRVVLKQVAVDSMGNYFCFRWQLSIGYAELIRLATLANYFFYVQNRFGRQCFRRQSREGTTIVQVVLENVYNIFYVIKLKIDKLRQHLFSSGLWGQCLSLAC